jgi:hypothetical protein
LEAMELINPNDFYLVLLKCWIPVAWLDDGTGTKSFLNFDSIGNLFWLTVNVMQYL